MATSIVAVALVAGAILLVVFVHRSLVTGLDAANSARARDVAAIIRAKPLPTTLPSTGKDNDLVQVVSADGTVLSASGNITGEPAVLAKPPPRRVTTASTTGSLPTADAGQSFRLLAAPVDLPSGPGWIYVATSLRQVDDSVSRTSTLLIIGVPFLVVVVAVVTWHAVGRALRPVERIRQSAAAIRGAGLSGRVPVPPTRDEIARLATTMNQMLARLETSAERQRQFVGDVSHELRSPLTALQAQVEVALAQPTGAPDSPVLRQVQQEANRMHILIDDMLFLARAEEQDFHLQGDPVDLDELLLAEVQRLRRGDGPVIEVGELDAARIPGSQRDLARMLKNLGNNAAVHAKSIVSLSLRHGPDEAVLTVTDDGPGIPAADHGRIFDRFVRLDQARSGGRPAGGAGLGLAIAQQIAHQHGGTITVTGHADGANGAVFTVRLPLRPQTGSAE